MLKRYLVIICCFSFLFACDQMNSKAEEEKARIDNDPYHQVAYYSNGNMRTEIRLDSNKRYHGIVKKFYKNGQVKSEIEFKHGIKLRAKQYYENGNLEMDFPYKDGKKHGLRKKYWEHGSIQSEMSYVNGQPKADLVEYKKNGEKVTRYPELVIKQIDNIDKTGQYIVQAYFSSNPQKGTYYIGELENGVLPQFIRKMDKKGKIGQQVFRPQPGTFFMKKFNVVGKFKTGYGNLLIVEKSINLAFSN